MMSWIRPDPHHEFQSDADELLSSVREAVDKRGHPIGADFEGRHIWSGAWKRRKQEPGLHKEKLARGDRLYAKCAYCERIRDLSRELDVDHYRPKAWITEWDGSPPIVTDIGPKEVDVGHGYWWLAFTWSNYVLACKTCNGGFKRNLFPVAGSREACIEGVELRERPLLLDPGSRFDPRDHFHWAHGTMEPLSEEGRATILTCGLNRGELVSERLKIANQVNEDLAEFSAALRRHDAACAREQFAKIAAAGSRREPFTSMTRWLVEEHLKCRWDDLDGVPG